MSDETEAPGQVPEGQDDGADAAGGDASAAEPAADGLTLGDLERAIGDVPLPKTSSLTTAASEIAQSLHLTGRNSTVAALIRENDAAAKALAETMARPVIDRYSLTNLPEVQGVRLQGQVLEQQQAQTQIMAGMLDEARKANHSTRVVLTVAILTLVATLCSIGVGAWLSRDGSPTPSPAVTQSSSPAATTSTP